MFCDRVAASKIYLGAAYRDRSPLDYYNGVKKKRVIHPQTAEQLRYLLTMLAKRGEEQTFRYIRAWRRGRVQIPEE